MSAETPVSKPADSAVRAPAEGGFMGSIRFRLLKVFHPHESSWVEVLALRAHGLAARGHPPSAPILAAWMSALRNRRLDRRCPSDHVIFNSSDSSFPAIVLVYSENPARRNR